MMAENWKSGTKKEAAVAMQQCGKHVSMAANKHGTAEEPWK
jgi:hypothetical protein